MVILNQPNPKKLLTVRGSIWELLHRVCPHTSGIVADYYGRFPEISQISLPKVIMYVCMYVYLLTTRQRKLIRYIEIILNIKNITKNRIHNNVEILSL